MPLVTCLLDWEKAFDRLKPEKIAVALRKYRVPEQIITAIQALYQNPTFWVELNNTKSHKKQQRRGIRQGCTLSPYLFIICMSAMFESIHRTDQMKANQHGRVRGTSFSELVYADDTIIITDDVTSSQEELHQIETHARYYGLSLNKDKCFAILFNTQDEMAFMDGTPVTVTREAIYLGVKISSTSDKKKELAERLNQCAVTWRKLSPFWNKSNIPKRIKLTIYDALIRSKLVYGMESLYFTQDVKSKVDAFQLKGLRRILNLPPTHIDRANTNTKIFELANVELNRGRKGPPRQIQQTSAYLESKALSLLTHIIRLPQEDPLRQVTFTRDTLPNIYNKRRPGRPRAHWTIENCRLAFHKLRDEQIPCPNIIHQDEDYDHKNPQHGVCLQHAAAQYLL